MALWPHLHQVHLGSGAAAPGKLPGKLLLDGTSSSAVAKRPRDASCLSVSKSVYLQLGDAYFYFIIILQLRLVLLTAITVELSHHLHNFICQNK